MVSETVLEMSRSSYSHREVASPALELELSQEEEAVNATFVTVYPRQITPPGGLYNAVAQVRAWTGYLEETFDNFNRIFLAP